MTTIALIVGGWVLLIVGFVAGTLWRGLFAYEAARMDADNWGNEG